MKYLFSGLIIMLLSFQILAAENDERHTVNRLMTDGFKEMSGAEIKQQLLGRVLMITDLQAGSIYETVLLESGARKLKKIKSESSKTLTDVDYQARAAILSENAKFSTEGNKIISTDGVRTYSIALFKKGNLMFGVRDVDGEYANFQIKLK